MPARVNFTDAGVAFDADGALAPAAQLVAKLRLAIDAGAIPEGATLPSIRTGAAELGVHSNTLRKVYAALEAQGYATTRHGSGTVAHVRDAAGAAAVRRIADGALASARGEGADAQLVAHGDPGRSRDGASAPPGRVPSTAQARRDARGRAAGARRRARRALAPAGAAARRHARLLRGPRDRATRGSSRAPGPKPSGAACACAWPGPHDDQTLGDLVWGCELVIVGRDARDDETAQRVLRSARDLLEMA